MKKATISNEELLADSQPQPVSTADLSTITERCLEMANIEVRLSRWADEAKKLTDRLRQLQDEVIPSLMAQVGMAKITLQGGVILEVKDVIQGSIPSLTSIEDCDDPMERESLISRRTSAFLWLRSNKATDLIRNTLKADFGAGHVKDATKFVQAISKLGFKVLRDENVHPGTLNKFLKERIEAGKDVPKEVFKLYTGSRAIMKAPKASRPK